MSKRITLVLGTLIVAFFSYTGYTDAVRTWHTLQSQKNQIEDYHLRYEKLDRQLDQTIQTKEKSQEEVKQLELEKQQLEEERQRLEQALQAKAKAQAKLVASSGRINVILASSVSCGDNQYAAYIYGMESGGRVVGNCDTASRSSNGCYGIGQDCNGVLETRCGADYACQNAFFNDYAIRRYGSWANAYAFHRSTGWW